MKQYYYIRNGQQAGPFPISGLQEAGITKETYVWTEGMAEWQKAGEINDLSFLFTQQTATPPPVDGVPDQDQTTGQVAHKRDYDPRQNYNYGTQQPRLNTPYEMLRPIPNSTAILVLGICSIVFSFCYGIGLILGIIGLVLNANAKGAYEAQPDVYDRVSFNNMNAGKICSIIGIILGVLAIIWVVFLFSHVMQYNPHLYPIQYAIVP